MLPAPTTIAISMPRAWTAAICAATARTRPGSVPYSRSPISASPDSFSRTRLNTGSEITSATSLADREAREPPDDDVLAGLRRQVRAQLLDRLAVEPVGVDVRLLEQDGLLHPLAQLALGDLRADVLGLVGGLALEHAQLGIARLGRDLLLGDVARRRRAGDVHRDVPGERDELVVARDEVRVAVDLDEHADLAVGVDVGLHRALGRVAAGELADLVAELHAQQLDGGVDVAVGLLQRALAVHHACAGLVAQGLDVLGADVTHLV